MNPESESFKNELAFSSVIYQLMHKNCNLSDTAVCKISQAENVLEDVLGGLDMLLNDCELKGYDSSKFKNLGGILRANGYDLLILSSEKINQIRGDFEVRVIQLNQLKKNPLAVYNNKKSQNLLELCEKMRDFYILPTKILD